MLEIADRRKVAQTKKMPDLVDDIMGIIDEFYDVEDVKSFRNTRIRINNRISDFIWGSEENYPDEGEN